MRAAPSGPLLLRRQVLDITTCEQIRHAMDRGTSDPADILDDQVTTDERVRRTRSIEVERHWLEVVEQQIESQRARVERVVGPLGPREGTGFLRYLPGGFYRPHRDRGQVAGWAAAARRAVAVVLFLNGGPGTPEAGRFVGGSLVLYPAPDGPGLEICPRVGMAVAFRADLLHEVRPVVSGIRDVAVDWFYDAATPRSR